MNNWYKVLRSFSIANGVVQHTINKLLVHIFIICNVKLWIAVKVCQNIIRASFVNGIGQCRGELNQMLDYRRGR